MALASCARSAPSPAARDASSEGGSRNVGPMEPPTSVAQGVEPSVAQRAEPSSAVAAAARTFDLEGASTVHDFRLTFPAGCPEAEKDEACAGAAELVVSRRDGSSSQTIHLDAAQVLLDEGGKPLVNATALYDRQGTVVVGDFDFDGREDFALLAGQHGPYGGPTFSVFLATRAGGFVRSGALSRLTEETLGMFAVDTEHKRLVTLAKSGCCWHVTERLAVVAGKPVVTSRVTEDATGDRLVITRERRVGGELRTSIERRALPR